ncbi:MAG TPA: polysaccharide biosynthesis/export family protein [Chitinophagaceae bacterium]
MKILRFLLLFAFSLYLVSCGTQRKIPPYYLQNSTDTTIKGQIVIPELRIQRNDLLSIQVYSASTKPEIDALYNLPAGAEGAAPSVNGFLVDGNGNIEYPRLGSIKAEGLTKQELADAIKKKLTQPVELLRDPTVIIRFLNYKITVLGNVGREGLVTLPGEKLTILEAIGMAGGITDYGQKDRVKIIRETDGKRSMGYVDLSSDSLFTSPYYHLVQNDVIIVEPTKQKQRMVDQAVTQQRISFALSIITTATLLYSIFR